METPSGGVNWHSSRAFLTVQVTPARRLPESAPTFSLPSPGLVRIFSSSFRAF
jgi:hypothetical protein